MPAPFRFGVFCANGTRVSVDIAMQLPMACTEARAAHAAECLRPVLAAWLQSGKHIIMTEHQVTEDGITFTLALEATIVDHAPDLVADLVAQIRDYIWRTFHPTLAAITDAKGFRDQIDRMRSQGKHDEADHLESSLARAGPALHNNSLRCAL